MEAWNSSAISIVINETKSSNDTHGKEYTTYLVKVQAGDKIWTLSKRYNAFFQFYEGVQAVFPGVSLPDFPPRLVWHTPQDIELRRQKLQDFLQDIISVPRLRNCWPVLFFLEVKQSMGHSNGKKILIPLPDHDFDPTEVCVPWKLLTLDGYTTVFATEKGVKAQCDQMLVRPEGVLFGQLGAEEEAKQFYKEMEATDNFCNPIQWSDINVADYAGMLLGGGHAPGMKQYLESATLQEKVSQFWALKRPLAAICHGALLLSRCKDQNTGKSVLFNCHTTTLPKYMENLGYYLTRWKHGPLFRTYEIHCEDEVRTFLENPETQFQGGPVTIGMKGNAYDTESGPGFVYVDKNYVSGRWPGDAYVLGRKFIEVLESKGDSHKESEELKMTTMNDNDEVDEIRVVKPVQEQQRSVELKEPPIEQEYSEL